MKKILLTGGCSWTDARDANFESPEDVYPMWPELIANRMKMKSLNLGYSGACNEYIFNKIVDHVYHNNIGMVIVVWTTWDRFSYMSEKNFKYPIGSFLMGNSKNKIYTKSKKLYDIEKEFTSIFLEMDDLGIKKYAEYCINNSLRYMFLLSEILKSMNIPYLFFQGLSPFPLSLLTEVDDIKFKYKESNFIKQILSNTHYKHINRNKNILGFPFLRVYGGYNLNHLLENSDRVSELDTHPNKKGQEKMADHIMGVINDRNFNL